MERWELIRDYAQELATKWQKMETTAKRWNVVFGESRKKVWLDVPKTGERLLERMNKCSQVIFAKSGINGATLFAVTYTENKFRIVSVFVAYVDGMMQRKYALDYQTTEIVVSKHAIERWLERNESDNVAEAVRELAYSTIKLDNNLGVMTITKGVVPVGFVERQVACQGGGVAFIKVENPEEERYPNMKWTVVTYISDDMVRHWNDDAIAAEFDNLTDIRTVRSRK